MTERLVGSVWQCGDFDYCNCTQAQITYRDDRGFWEPIWRGKFHTDGTWEKPTAWAELKKTRKAMKAAGLHHLVRWDFSRYD